MIGRAYRVRELDTQLGFSEDDIKIWNNIQDNLASKKWTDIDSIFEQENQRLLIEELLTSCIKPLLTKNIWAKDDIFVKKCEGFQRLALTIEYNRMIHERTSNRMSYLPFDTIGCRYFFKYYQHASRLTGKSGMAESVNVLPNEDLSPRDVYTKVAEKVSHDIKNNRPFVELDYR